MLEDGRIKVIVRSRDAVDAWRTLHLTMAEYRGAKGRERPAHFECNVAVSVRRSSGLDSTCEVRLRYVHHV